MDEVESWYDKQKDSECQSRKLYRILTIEKRLLLHIQHAQLIPPMVLSELIYILAYVQIKANAFIKLIHQHTS